MIHPKTTAIAGFCLALASCAGSKANEAGALEITSPALRADQPIPAEYACTDSTHLGKSPPLSWTKGPEGTAAYAVTMRDPDAKDFVHWALINLPPSTTSLPGGASPGGALPSGAIELSNDFGKPGYGGPCPPPGALHHYVIEVTALGTKLGATKADAKLFQQIEANALASGRITVTYQRSQ
jgi:Raf kinase inhibitor-like YbhB/YbcL family protein